MYKTLKAKHFEAWVAALETTTVTDAGFVDFYALSTEHRVRIVDAFENWWEKYNPAKVNSDTTNCQVCGICVFEGVIGYNYMVNNKVWEIEAGFQYDQFAHLACLETKIGRKLVIDDFNRASINGLILWMLKQGIEIPRT